MSKLTFQKIAFRLTLDVFFHPNLLDILQTRQDLTIFSRELNQSKYCVLLTFEEISGRPFP